MSSTATALAPELPPVVSLETENFLLKSKVFEQATEIIALRAKIQRLISAVDSIVADA